MHIIVRIAIGVAGLAGIAAAPPQPTNQAKPAVGAMNEIVCQRQEILGSRIGAKKVCKSRADWASERLDDRQMTEKAQTQRGNGDPR